MKLTLLAAAAALTLSTHGAAALGQKDCALMAGMVVKAVDARKSGLGAQDAAQRVGSGLDGAAQKFVSVVPAVVDWVYKLPQDKMGPEVADGWMRDCVKY